MRLPRFPWSIEPLERREVLSALSLGGEFLMQPSPQGDNVIMLAGPTVPGSGGIGLSDADFQALLSLRDQTSSADQAAAAPTMRREIVFIDEAVPDAEALFDDLAAHQQPRRELTVIRVDSRRDGVEQISQALATDVVWDAVHIISHGSRDGFQIGSTWLNATSVAGYSADIQNWRQTLSTEADLFVYGCDLAGTARGRELLDTLRMLTGADIAASDDPTGSSQLGGDWTLEFTSGPVETAAVTTVDFQQRWQHTLAAGFTVTPTSGLTTSEAGGTATFTV
ncbi:MAG: DUF4347 domain-containing protein, partial [Planctomycetales bacterium]|nr:DUF4347 domain-containing protein [Planctomycetales bacterium]